MIKEITIDSFHPEIQEEFKIRIDGDVIEFKVSVPGYGDLKFIPSLEELEVLKGYIEASQTHRLERLEKKNKHLLEQYLEAIEELEKYKEKKL